MQTEESKLVQTESETYEAPRVEVVLTGDEIERESHYAGGGGGSLPPG